MYLGFTSASRFAEMDQWLGIKQASQISKGRKIKDGGRFVANRSANLLVKHPSGKCPLLTARKPYHDLVRCEPVDPTNDGDFLVIVGVMSIPDAR